MPPKRGHSMLVLLHGIVWPVNQITYNINSDHPLRKILNNYVWMFLNLCVEFVQILQRWHDNLIGFYLIKSEMVLPVPKMLLYLSVDIT